MWCKQSSEFQGLFKDLDRIEGLFKVTIKIQNLFKIVRTMKAIVESTQANNWFTVHSKYSQA